MATGFNTQVGNGEYRLQFETDNKEYYLLMQETARRCVDGKTVTNADRIRAMSDEELCNWLFQRDCTNIAAFLEYGGMGVMNAVQLLEWLQQPAEENDNG